jgi:hypothetical protein
MKRIPVVAAAIFAGTIPFQREIERADCDQAPCAVEPMIATPEQPHSSEEQFENIAEVEYVVIPISPAITVPKGGAFHLEWEASTGQKAWDITDPETLKWIRERAQEREAEKA